jgi:hypothetical protein
VVPEVVPPVLPEVLPAVVPPVEVEELPALVEVPPVELAVPPVVLDPFVPVDAPDADDEPDALADVLDPVVVVVVPPPLEQANKVRVQRTAA